MWAKPLDRVRKQIESSFSTLVRSLTLQAAQVKTFLSHKTLVNLKIAAFNLLHSGCYSGSKRRNSAFKQGQALRHQSGMAGMVTPLLDHMPSLSLPHLASPDLLCTSQACPTLERVASEARLRMRRNEGPNSTFGMRS